MAQMQRVNLVADAQLLRGMNDDFVTITVKTIVKACRCNDAAGTDNIAGIRVLKHKKILFITVDIDFGSHCVHGVANFVAKFFAIRR